MYDNYIYGEMESLVKVEGLIVIVVITHVEA
jgi:hypothetical protein